MKKILIITFFFLSFFQYVNSNEKKIKILFQINDKIISNIDVLNEINYLKMLNKDLKNLDKDKIDKIAQNSIIREVIKKDEITKFYKINYETGNVEKYINELIKNLGFSSEADFENYLSQNGLSINDIKKKLIIEKIWNRLIYDNFKNKIKIDENKILDELNNLIENNTYQKSFNISEIVFSEKDKTSYNQKYSEILNDIKNLGFKQAATIHSIANTSTLGGEIGWVNENQISKKILDQITKLENGQWSNPIATAGGSVIFLINETKDVLTEEVDKDLELSKLIAAEKNRQLNEYSIIHYKKIENNSYVKKF